MKLTIESPHDIKATIDSGAEVVTSDLLDMFIAAAVGVSYHIDSIHEAIMDKADQLIEDDLKTFRAPKKSFIHDDGDDM